MPTPNTTADTAFSAVAVRKIGDHTYLPVDFYDLRSRDTSEAEVIEACLEEADKSGCSQRAGDYEEFLGWRICGLISVFRNSFLSKS